jgi:hypothetical protein
LGLRVAGAYLANPASRHRNAASYLRDLPSDPAQALSRACDITLEAIAESGYPQARQVLWLLAILHTQPIPLAFVRMVAESGRLTEIRRSADVLDSVISKLHEFCLVSVVPADRQLIELHSLLAEVYRAEGLRSRQSAQLLETAGLRT